MRTEHDEDCERRTCECGRGVYHTCEYNSCYDCFLDRRADYVACIYCERWHSPDFDTCFQCRPQGRDEAATELKRVILTRDGFKCRYCGVQEGDPQVDPRLIRPKCPSGCAIQHNHRYPCEPRCGRRHRHRKRGDHGTCAEDCRAQHSHLAKDDDGIRAARLHIDHIRPCAKDGTADPWNLQTLCGVCNVSKGSDWVPLSRHHHARRLIVSAYLTYLWDFLTAGQQEDLAVDAEFEEKITHAEALQIIKDDYADRARETWHEPRPDVVIEDVPPEYAEFDLPADRSG